jgi:hypothetical protein
MRNARAVLTSGLDQRYVVWKQAERFNKWFAGLTFIRYIKTILFPQWDCEARWCIKEAAWLKRDYNSPQLTIKKGYNAPGLTVIGSMQELTSGTRAGRVDGGGRDSFR